MRTRAVALLLIAVFLLIASGACTRPSAAGGALTVAAASNLMGVIEPIASAFTRRTGVPVVFSFGATAVLAQQIENGAPFDVFAAADAVHVDALVKAGKITPATHVYAVGRLAVWVPPGAPTLDPALPIRTLKDLAAPQVRFIAIAQPSIAPYGEAAVEALQASGLWEQIQPKVVYAENINQAKQLGASGNTDAAFTAYSLVLHEAGRVILVDPKLYPPIDQALGVVAASQHAGEALQFARFVLGPEGRAILRSHGYDLP